MCQQCYDFAMHILLDRMQRLPDRPREVREWEPRVLALMEAMYEEVGRYEDVTQEQINAGGERLLKRIQQEPTEIVYRLRDLVRTQLEFLDQTEDVLLDELNRRAIEGDPMAREMFERSGVPISPIQVDVHVINLDKLHEERKRRRPEMN